MAIFAAYFDDSSRDDVFAIAGYVARLETWDDDFTPAWREVLARAPRAISEFKATDCRNQLGEFKDWDKEECDELTKNLVDVIEHHTDRDNFLGIGIAVSLPQAESIHGFQSLSRREQRYKRRLREKDVFEVCMKLIYVDILTIGARVADESTDTLDLIFDEPTKGKGTSRNYFDEIRALVGAELQCYVPSPVFRDSKIVVPLQAADLLVHETARELINRGPPRLFAVSKALQRLVCARWHMASFLKTELLLEYRRRALLGMPSDDLRAGILYMSPDLSDAVDALREPTS